MARQVVYERSGEPAEVLRVREVGEAGPPGRGQVLVRVSMFSIHPGDLVGIAGPFAGTDGAGVVPGAEATGTIEAIGPDTPVGPGVCVGARVTVFLVPGCWQDWVLAPAELVLPVPDDMPDAVAAQLMINPLTAVLLANALVRIGAVGPSRVVVQSAAGSTVAQLLAVELGHYPGMLVNLVRSDIGATRLRELLPRVPVISTARPGWQQEVRDAAGDRPIAAVVDAVAGDLAGSLLELLDPDGSLLTYGALAPEPMGIHANTLLQKGLRVESMTISRWPATVSQRQRARDIDAAQALGTESAALLRVSAVYDLDELPAAIGGVGRPGKAGTVIVSMS